MSDKVEELRNELRSKRTERPEEYSGGADWDAASANATSGSSYQTLRREGGTDDNTYRQVASTSGSGGEDRVGSGQGDRRPSSNNSSVYDGTATPARRGRRTRGRIEADDDVPVRTGSAVEIDYPVSKVRRGRKPKTTALPIENIPVEPSKKRYFRVKTLPFTSEEALAKAEPLQAALTDIFRYTDEYLWWIAEDELKQPIWSDISDDPEEMGKLMGTALENAQQSGTGAAIVNNIILTAHYIALGGITISRLARTLKLLGTAQVKRKQKRQLQVVK